MDTLETFSREQLDVIPLHWEARPYAIEVIVEPHPAGRFGRHLRYPALPSEAAVPAAVVEP
jgi:hypothetical protein